KMLLDAIGDENAKLLVLKEITKQIVGAADRQVVVVRPPQDDVRVPGEELVAAAIGPGRSRRDPVLIGAPVPCVPRPVVEDHVVGEVLDVDPAAYLLVVAADRANAAPGGGLSAD